MMLSIYTNKINLKMIGQKPRCTLNFNFWEQNIVTDKHLKMLNVTIPF